MRLEEMIASADDPEVVREEGAAALAQAERLAHVVSQLLGPAPAGWRADVAGLASTRSCSSRSSSGSRRSGGPGASSW